MLDKLTGLYERFHEIESQLSDAQIISNISAFARLNKEYKDLKPIANVYLRYEKVLNGLDECKMILSREKDIELKQVAKSEMEELTVKRSALEEEIKVLLTPKDPDDSKNAVVEIRAGTGGNEASIFAGDLYRMYSRFCERNKLKIEPVDFNQGTVGGYKEIVFNVIGESAYGTLKFESGVHRVQRVPVTEQQGRIHTSAATVVVLPQPDELDITIKENDIRKDTFCSSGHGGQSVNTTYSAVRLTHIPSGIVVQCQDERSQIKNYQKALAVLRARLYQAEHDRRTEIVSQKRKTMVSTGDRSAKIRTYNYPQSRVTDHRIQMTIFNLPVFLDGDIRGMIEALQVAENTERLKEPV
ncbi:MAG: peptide chain release factor 1 [Bacteroidetes bacterium]|nr:peptide chain release factor 1 [Bacteroidota bacterium]